MLAVQFYSAQNGSLTNGLVSGVKNLPEIVHLMKTNKLKK